MDEQDWLADRFEERRAHLRAVAYRMLGSLAEADDAVQDTWLRVSRSGADNVENLGAWLTTIVARVCLNIVRSRNTRRRRMRRCWRTQVSLALLVVLDTLTPSERLAFVLHDMFQLPFDEIAPMIDRSPAAARQLASRGRRRVKAAEIPAPDADLARQRQVVDAFFQAARGGDFDALVALLDPDVVLRSDTGGRRSGIPSVIQGAAAVARQARPLPNAELVPALVNGAPGVVVTVGGRPIVVMSFIVAGGRILEIDAIADPARVHRLAAAAVEAR